MKNFILVLFFSFLYFTNVNAQIENITKKSKEQSEKKSSNSSRNESLPSYSGGSDPCTDACLGCASDMFFELLATHEDYLLENNEAYPNLVGFLLDANVGLMPANNIFGIMPNYELNGGIVGGQGSYYHLFQAKEDGRFTAFTATDYFFTLNLGLIKGHSIQAGFGGISDLTSKISYPAFVLSYSAYYNEYKNSIELRYKQSTESVEDIGIPYINAHILFRIPLFQTGSLYSSAVAGFKYQRFYGEDLLFMTGGLSFSIH